MDRLLRNLARMAVGPLRERGWYQTWRSIRGCRAAQRREREESFDQKWGTDTGRSLSMEELRADGDDVPMLWRYWPTLPRTFARIMEDLEVRHQDYTFVDLGSGKGRVLMMAAQWPFRRIVGVELCPSLHQVAQRNLAGFHGQGCRDFQLVCCDAARYPWPREPVVAYMFQPFPKETMRSALDNLRRSSSSTVLAYLNPIFHDLVVDCGFALEKRRGGDDDVGFEWAVYRSGRAGR